MGYSDKIIRTTSCDVEDCENINIENPPWQDFTCVQLTIDNGQRVFHKAFCKHHYSIFLGKMTACYFDEVT